MRLNKTLLLLMSLVLMLSLVVGVSFAKDEEGKGKTVPKTVGKSSALLDINMIECYVSNDGSFGENPSTGGDGFYFPKGQRTLSIIYTAGLWFLGKQDGEIKSAVNCYGAEFQPGVILPSGLPDDPLDPKYVMYKYNAGDAIDADAIAQGCPDEVLGDQMLFSVYNDIMDHSGMWGKPPMGLEVQHTVFGFNRSGALGHTVFQRLRVANKGDTDMLESYLGIFYDPDLGQANDDLTGCDSTLGLAIVFNGDGYDEKYGVGVPAMGSDFFQGPIVPSPGEDATLPDGTIIPDSKIMGMTAYFVYINGSPIAGMTDPHTPEGGYYFCSGFLGNGDEWIDPTAGNLPTKFPFAGDPVKGTGWLLSSVSSPKDVRMGNATGPFDLLVGEEQDVVLGCVVGLGTDNLSSITVMKFYDAAAQLAYDKNFILPAPPAQPVIAVAEMDGELMLNWDEEASYHDDDDYVFQGYNIYQGKGIAGPWTKIGTYDVVDGITTIWDLEYAPTIGALVEQPVQFGADTGVKFNFFVEKDYVRNIPLVNGRPYYFAVTAYAYNPAGVPKVLENAQNGVTGVPQKPVLDVEYNAELGDQIAVTHVGPSQGAVVVTVTDPTIITGDEYEVTFWVDDDEESDHYHETSWTLTNIITGEVLLDERWEQGTDVYAESKEGLNVQVQGPSAGILHWIQVANPTYPEPMPADQIDATDDYVGNNVWLSLSCPDDENHNGRYFWSYDGAHLGDLSASHDYEIRWTDGVVDYSWGEWGFEDGNFDKVPFELWDVGFATPFDDSDDERMIPIMYSAGTTTTWDVPSGNMAENNWGYACSDRVYFYYPDLPFTYDDYHAAAEAADFGTADGMWGLGDRSRPIGRVVVVNYTHEYTGPAPSAGSVDRIMTNKPNSPADTFSFSTAEYKASKSADVAKERLDDINVFPNPYFGHNSAEGTFYSQFVTFNNLPEDCTIRIFSLSGQLVNTLEHNNGTPFQRWYLQNHEEIPCASGMYIVHIDTEFGDKIIKLAIVNRLAQYQHI